MTRRHHISCRCNFCVLRRNAQLRRQERQDIGSGGILPPGSYPYEAPGDHPVIYEDEVEATRLARTHADGKEGRRNRPERVSDDSGAVRNRPPPQPEQPRADGPPDEAAQPVTTKPPSQAGARRRGRWGRQIAALALIALGVAGVAIWLFVFDGISSVGAPPGKTAGGTPPVTDAELDAMIAAALTRRAPTPTLAPPQPTWTPLPRPTATPRPRPVSAYPYSDGATAITNNADGGPAWSPDGRQIVFASGRDGDWEIYVMYLDGSYFIRPRLTHNSSHDSHPAWSPDGREIVFASDRDGDWEIYVMNADRSDVTQITHNPSYDGHPAWSPDGRRIAFASNRNGRREIYVMNADGSDVAQITHNPSYDGHPAWSPDGRRIAFASNRNGRREIYVMNADGSGVTQITHNFSDAGSPAWSLDGRRIAFASYWDGDSEIYVMNADGSDVTQITHNSGGDYRPAWSPDGRWIAFNSYRDGDYKIYVIAVPP